MSILDRVRASRASLAAALLLLATACAGPRADAPPAVTGSGERQPMPSDSGRFFGYAYDQILDKYVSPVSLATVAPAGLANLSKVDAQFQVAQANGRLEARDHGNLIESFEIPRGDEARRWAQVTVAVIEAGRARSQALRDAAPEALYQAVFDGMVQRLDPYTRYSGRDAAREQRAFRDGFGGIGVTINTEGGDVRIQAVVPESPAARGGVQVDDRVVLIDGQPTTGLDTREVVRRLRGPINQAVRLSVQRDGQMNLLEISLVRALIVPPTITYRRDGDVAYIKLSSFNQRTTDQLNESLRRAQREIGPNLKGVILDLRGNLGGLLDQAISVSEVFMSEGQIVSTRGRHRLSQQVSEARGGGVGRNLPVVVLVNGSSASASEIVAAALQDNGRAVVVGSTSFGKGSVQTVISLPNDGELVLTWARFHAPSGYPLQDLGVSPTICTSGKQSAAEVVEAARNGRMTSRSQMQTWRAADHSNQDLMKQLRQICPPESKENELDLQVAQQILSDRSLYARALQSTSQFAALR